MAGDRGGRGGAEVSLGWAGLIVLQACQCREPSQGACQFQLSAFSSLDRFRC